MNYVFFGTPEFAAIILEKLIGGGFPPAAVVCNPDRPVGRKKVVTAPPTKIIAEKYSVNVLQPEKLDESFKFQVSSFGPEFFVVAAYAKIIPKEFLEIPRLGTIGVHPSLLPKYRGPSPIQTAILDGSEKTGVTLYLLDEKVDHGPILARRELGFPISPDHKAIEDPRQNRDNFQFSNLLQKLAEVGGSLLVEILPKFMNSEIKPQLQDESEATYTKKFTAEDGFVAPEDLDAATSGSNLEMALAIERKIRALNQEPGVWTLQNEKRTKLLEAKITDGKLNLKKIQVEGKKPIGL